MRRRGWTGRVGGRHSSGSFDQFFILTAGGPDNSTTTVVMLVYREAFRRFDLGTAAALSVIVLIVLLVINIGQFRFLRRDVED